MGSERRIPGEGLAERMGARERRRPRIGMSPAFYTRLGLDDPWATSGTPEGGEAAANGMVFLSAAPFHAMMRKLAAARRRRDRHQERFAQGRAGITMRAARRFWPGEGVTLPTSRLSALSLDAMLLPEPPAPAPVAAAPVEVEAAAPRRRNEPTPAIRTTWSESPFAPARVVRGGSASDHAGARIARAVQSVARAGETDALPQLSRAAVARTRRRVEVEQELPTETVEVVRRTRLARPVVRIIEEQLAPNSAAPVARAAARGALAAGSARAPASRSPSISMAALAVPPSFERAAEFDSAAAQSLAAPQRGEAMRPHAARRVPPATRAASRSARETSTPAASLSASPVSAARVSAGRPVAIAPVARASVSAAGAGGRSPAAAPAAAPSGGESPPVASLRRPARASAAAMARALHAAPMSEVAPESAPVRRRTDASSTTAPSAPTARLERSVSGAIRRPARASLDTTLPQPLGASAEPTTLPATTARIAAEPAAVPVRANTVRAAMRAEPAPRPGAVSPRGVSADHTPAARADRPVRASAAVQLDNGSFISSRALAAMEGPAPALRSARGEALSVGEAVPRATIAAGRAAPPAERPLDRSTRAAAPVTLRATVASERPEGPMAWAAERLAPAVQPTAAARSALRRVAPELRLPTPAEAPAVVETADAPTRHLPARPAVASRRDEAALPTAQAASPAAPSPATRALAPSARAVVARKAGGMASAVARASRAAAAAPAVQAESPTTSARRPAQVRRSGPLSWARPVSDGQLVASAAPARRTDSPSRPAAAAPSRGWTGAPASPDFVLPHTALPEALAELRDAGLIQSAWSPSTPVRTPDGRYVSARVAAAMPNLALLPSAGGPTVVSTLPQRRMAGFRSPEVRFVGAPTAQAADGEFTGARTARSRPTDWVGARSAVSEATAYRGAMGVRTPEVTFAGAGSTTTPTTGFAGARSAVTESGQFVGARSAVTESGAFVGARSGAGESGAFVGARTAATSGASAPSRAGAPTGARAAGRGTTRGARTGAPEALPLAGGRAEAVAEVQAPVQRVGRPSLESTLASVSESSLPANAPTWAARSDGAPRVRSAQGLFESLARATTAEQVVGVIAARAGEMSGPVPLTDPMRAVVEQIRQELRPSTVAAEGTVLQTRAPDIAAPETTVLRPSRSSGPVASSAIMRSGGTRPVRSSALVRGPGGADDRVSKLVKRLTDLIHLAENERRLSEAQAQVRMAEDTAAARAEGSAPVGNSGNQGSKLDIETFAREVLEVVNRELELRRERRTEDGDESNWW